MTGVAIRLSCLLLVLYGVDVAKAAEYWPTTGLVYNVKENGSLRYTCKKNSEVSITCDFVQVSIRKHLTINEVEKKIAESEKQFSELVKEINKEGCYYTELLETLEGKRPAQKPEIFALLTSEEKQEILTTTRVYSRFCESKSKTDYMAMINFDINKKLRTCTVSSNPYTQNFKLINNDVNEKISWVVDGAPQGSCGVVALSRFEPYYENGVKTPFWKYYARKAITNPRGISLLGMSCSDLDEAEYPYDWRSKERRLGCDYIEFSNF